MRSDVPERDQDGLVPAALTTVTHWTSRHPIQTLVLVLLVCAASLTYCAAFLQFKTERSDLIDPDTDYQRRWLNYTAAFGDAADMVVIVEGQDPERIKEVLDDLGAQLEREPELFTSVLYKVDHRGLQSKGLQYYSPDQLQTRLAALEELGPVLKGQWHLFTLRRIYLGLRHKIASTETIPDRAEAAGPLLRTVENLTTSLTEFAENRQQFEFPWEDLLGEQDPRQQQANQVRYLMNEAGTMGFLKAQPAGRPDDFDGAREAVDRLRELIDDAESRHADVTIGLTGIPVLESDEMRSSQESMIWQSVIAYLGVGVLLLVGFRGIKHPLLGQLMLAVGTALAFGLATATIGHLNILSVSFVTILVGLGSDYAILYLSRYLELRHQGQELLPALIETSRSIGPGITTAAATTSLAFFCAIFTDFLGVAELGVIAGGGILLCALSAFCVIPSSIALLDRRTAPADLPRPARNQWLRAFVSGHPGFVVLSSIILIGAVAFHGFRVEYDYNLMNLQADGLESVEIQKRLARESENNLLFAVSLADSPEEALELKRKFEQLPTVSRVVEMASRLPAHPPEETQLLVQAIHVLLQELPARMPDAPPAQPEDVGDQMERLYKSLKGLDLPAARRAGAALDRFLDQLDSYSTEAQAALLTEYEQRMRAELLQGLRMMAAVSDPEPVGPADLPPALRERYVSRQGQWLLQIFPKEQIWDIEPLSRFVADVRTVDPEVTGTPLQNFEASRQIRHSYERVALYALLAIFLVLLVDFLSFRDTLLVVLGPLAGVAMMAGATRTLDNPMTFHQLAVAYVLMMVTLVAVVDFKGLRDILFALMPPLAGFVLMMGLLGLFQIDLNPANLIILPLIVGIGVDNGVHVMHDYRHQKARYRPSASTINSLVLTSCTNMVGFGSMIIAAHRGLKSIGLVSTIGVGSCLFISVITLPAILTLLSRFRHRGEGEASEDESADKQSARRPELTVFIPPESAA